MKAGTKEYKKVHNDLRSKFGRADHCAIDKNHKSKFYDWANISRKYLQDISDWIMLCRNCHIDFDRYELTVQQLKDRVMKRQEGLKQEEIAKEFAEVINSVTQKPRLKKGMSYIEKWDRKLEYLESMAM